MTGPVHAGPVIFSCKFCDFLDKECINPLEIGKKICYNTTVYDIQVVKRRFLHFLLGWPLVGHRRIK